MYYEGRVNEMEDDKMNYKLEYNKAVEFIGAISKYTLNNHRESQWNSEDLKSDPTLGILDFSPSPDVKNWLEYVNNNISPFLSNDLIFVTNKVFGLLDICFYLVITEDLQTPIDLLQAIKTLNDDELIKMAYEYYEIDTPLNGSLQDINKAISHKYSDEIASSFIQVKNSPDEYKAHIIKSFEGFYSLFFQPYEEKVYKIMEEKLQGHLVLFEKDPINFVNTIGLGDYSKIIKQYDEIKLYSSYYIDLGLFYFSIGDKFIIFYGKTIENRFSDKEDLEFSKSLFKALSDDRRVEIIRLTSKRPWYNKELAEHFNLSTATLSYHLNLLLDLGILKFEPSIINNRYYYSTDIENLEKLFTLSFQSLLK